MALCRNKLHVHEGVKYGGRPVGAPFWALLWKQWARRRSLRLLFLCELLFPIIMAGLVVHVRHKSPAFVYKVTEPLEPVLLEAEVNDKHQIPEKVLESGDVGYRPYLSPLRNTIQTREDDTMDAEHVASATLEQSLQHKALMWKMAYGPTDDLLKNLSRNSLLLPKEHIVLVETEQEMVDLLLEAYRSREYNYLGGAYVYDPTANETADHVGRDQTQITIKYRLFHELSNRLVSQYWNLEPEQISNEVVGLFRRRFHFLQWIPVVDYSKHCHGDDCSELQDFYVKPSFYTIPFPATRVRTIRDTKMAHVTCLIYFFPLGFLASWAILVHAILQERECGIAESERAAGAGKVTQYLAWYLGAFIPLAVSCAISSWIITYDFSGGNGAALDTTSCSLLFVTLLLFAASNLAFCSIIVALTRTVFAGTVVTVGTWLVAGYVSSGLLHDHYFQIIAWAKFIVSFLHPHCSFIFALQVIALNYINGDNLYWQDIVKGASLDQVDRVGRVDDWCLLYSLICLASSVPLYLGVGAILARVMHLVRHPHPEVSEAWPAHLRGEIVAGMELHLANFTDSSRGSFRGTETVVFEQGTMTVVWGQEGSGKTSLCSTLAGTRLSLGRPLGPIVLWGDVGLTLGPSCFHQHLTVRDNLLLFAKLRGEKDPLTEAMSMEEELSLLHVSRWTAQDLPPAMQARLVIGICLVGTPDLAVLDEPWSWPSSPSLDHHEVERERSQLRDLLSSMSEERDIPIVLTTTDGREALEMGWKVAALRSRFLWAFGSPEDVLRDVEAGYVVEVAGDETEGLLERVLPWAEPANLIDRDDEEDTFGEGKSEAAIVPPQLRSELIEAMPDLEASATVRLRYVTLDEAVRRGIHNAKDLLALEEDTTWWSSSKKPPRIGLGGSTGPFSALLFKSVAQVWRNPWTLTWNILLYLLLFVVAAVIMRMAGTEDPVGVGYEIQVGSDQQSKTTPWDAPPAYVTVEAYKDPTMMFWSGGNVSSKIVKAFPELFQGNLVKIVNGTGDMAADLKELGQLDPDWYRRHCLGGLELTMKHDAYEELYMDVNIYFNPYYPLTANLEMDALANAQSRAFLKDLAHPIKTIYHPLPRLDKLEYGFLQHAPRSRMVTCTILSTVVLVVAMSLLAGALMHPVLKQARNLSMHIHMAAPVSRPMTMAMAYLMAHMPIILSISLVATSLVNLIYNDIIEPEAFVAVWIVPMLGICSLLMWGWGYMLILGGKSTTFLTFLHIGTATVAPVMVRALYSEVLRIPWRVVEFVRIVLMVAFPGFTLGDGFARLLLLMALNGRCDLLSKSVVYTACEMLEPPSTIKYSRDFVANTNYRCCAWSCGDKPCANQSRLLAWKVNMTEYREKDMGEENSIWVLQDKRAPKEEDFQWWKLDTGEEDWEDEPEEDALRSAGGGQRGVEIQAPGVFQDSAVLVSQVLLLAFFLWWKGKMGWKKARRRPSSLKEACQDEADSEGAPWIGQSSACFERYRVNRLLEMGQVEAGCGWALVLRQVHGMSLAQRKGECVAVVGDPEGTSRLAEIVSGQRRTMGIWVDGIGDGWPTKVGFCPGEGLGFCAELTAAESLWMIGLMRGLEEGESRLQAKRWARIVGLGPAHLRVRTGHLASSYQQLLRIAQAAMGTLPLVLLHNPLRDLHDSVRGRASLRRAIRELKKTRKSGILLVGSGSGLGWGSCEALCDRVAVLGPGGRLESILRASSVNSWQSELKPGVQKTESETEILGNEYLRRRRNVSKESVESKKEAPMPIGSEMHKQPVGLVEVHLYLEAQVVEDFPWEVDQLKVLMIECLGRPAHVHYHNSLHMTFFLPSPPTTLSAALFVAQDMCTCYRVVKDFHVEHSSRITSTLIIRHY